MGPPDGNGRRLCRYPGASAAQQGASVANDLYAELRNLPASAFAAEPEFQQLAREHGQDKARDILAAAATTRALGPAHTHFAVAKALAGVPV